MSLKLQNILLKLANDVLDLEKSGKTLGEPIDEATQAILDLLDTFSSSAENDSLENAIKRCGYGFRSLSLHSDGRWIAKSGAGTGKFLTTGKTPLEAVLRLEAKLDVRKVIKEG